jgi:hypothetical protein
MDVGSTIKLSLFAYDLMAVIAGLCAVLIHGIVFLLAQAKTRREKAEPPKPVLVSVVPARDESAEIAAAIAAAVHAVIGAHRLVHIGPAGQGSSGWTSEIRSRLHTSHTPRRG